jgi:L-amino acid N-acyltransferase YncA
MSILVAPMRPEHAPAVRAIYQSGLDDGDASFEVTAPAWSDFDAAHRADLRYVALSDEAVVGWLACAPVSARAAYAGVVEHSVYVDPAARGSGVGRTLLAVLLDATTAAGVWMVQSALFPENAASLALHRRMGFRVVGRRERIARRDGRWRDTVLLEWRNPRIDG